jgi:outer membrane protein insertion porin family
MIHSDKVSVDAEACRLGLISTITCASVGKFLTSQIGYILTLDRRNDPILPTRGWYLNFGQDFAGVGGDVKYVKTTLEGTFYRGITNSMIFQARATGGYVLPWGGDSVRISDRFFVGGTNFRGFEVAGVGPRDTTYAEALGAKLYAVGSLELNFPNLLPQQYGIRPMLFLEFGTAGKLDKSAQGPNVVDDLALRASYGLSVFWNSPMGPIRLDFSKILRKEPYDRTEGFRFSTSTSF